MGVLINPKGPSKIHCFACKYGGKFEDALRDLARLSGEDYSKIIRLAGEYEELDLGVVVDQIPAYDSYKKAKPEVKLSECILDDVRGQAARYLLDRGFDLEILKEWESGYDSAYNRAVFPVRSIAGNLVGAVGRTVNDHKIKYFNYFGFDKSMYLFGEHKTKEGTTLVVVEGLLDTVKVWQALHTQDLLDRYSVVGILGSEASFDQCRKAVGLSDDVILFFDNDRAGRVGERNLALHLQKKVLLRSVDYPANVGNDPDDVVEHGCSLSDLFSASKLIVAERGKDWR
jgi:DNA primase